MSALLDKLRRTPRKLYIPYGDLGLDQESIRGLAVPDDVPIVLAVNVIQTPDGPRIIQGGAAGEILQTLRAPIQTNLIAPRTDTTSFIGGDLVTPKFTVAIFKFNVTAISGTGASVTFTVAGKDSQGGYSSTNGGGSATAITTVTAGSLVFTASATTLIAMLAPVYRIQAAISGTTPSVSWWCDINYK